MHTYLIKHLSLPNHTWCHDYSFCHVKTKIMFAILIHRIMEAIWRRDYWGIKKADLDSVSFHPVIISHISILVLRVYSCWLYVHTGDIVTILRLSRRSLYLFAPILCSRKKHHNVAVTLPSFLPKTKRKILSCICVKYAKYRCYMYMCTQLSIGGCRVLWY